MATATIGSRAQASGMLIAAALVSAGCPNPAPASRGVPPATPPATSHDPQVHQFSNNWGTGLGCTPNGEPLSLSGTLVVRPFGKGTDGAVVKTESDEWVVSYRAEGALLALQGKRVVATGRACEKQGASIGRRHLDLATLTEAAPTNPPP